MPSHPPPSVAGTPSALFAEAYAADPSRPVIVWYDDAPTQPPRIELSVATLANWVAKTGNLLQDTAGVCCGERLALALPSHWLAPVWLLAGFAAGMVIDLDELDGADAAVVGPDALEAGDRAGASELIACGTAPLGGPFGGSLPDGALDFGSEAPGHADHFQPVDPPRADGPALIAGGRTHTGTDVLSAARDRAAKLGLSSGDRVLTAINPTSPVDPAGYLDALLAPLAVGGSVVLVAHPDADAQERRASEEKVTVRL